MKLAKEERISQLMGLLARASHRLRIEAGELNCELYNNARIANSLRDVAERIRVTVQTSPVICVDEMEGHNTILELWRKGKAELFVRNVRGDRIHRWIGDDSMVYSEDFHAPLASDADREVMVLNDEKLWAGRAVENFDGRIADGEVCKASEDNLLLLTPSTILAVCVYFEKRGEDYNYKTKNEIEEAAAQFC